MTAPGPEGGARTAAPNTFRLVVRNTAFLTLAQVLSFPLAIALNAITARYLGPSALGYLYLATTFNSFGFLVVDWGSHGALPALVATDRTRAGKLLGSALAWRAGTSLFAYAAMAGTCHLLGYDRDLQVAVALVAIGYALSSMANAGHHVIMGFERTDIAAGRQVIEEIGRLVFVVPILLLGGSLTHALWGHALAVVAMSIYIWRALRLVEIGPLSVDLGALKIQLRHGTPFIFAALVMVLQPYVDAIFLSKLSPSDVVGWHAAARKLVGVLVFPAAALIGALYPTLCRLFTTDMDEFRRATSGALRGTTALVLPVALGCALFPDIGIAVYSRGSFGPAEDNLRVLSLFVLLVYFTMPMGISLMAAGKQRPWALVQSISVLMSAVLDPILIPWSQARYGNGGLGVCIAAVASEIFIVIFGLWLTPKGIFNRRFFRTAASAVLGGVGMVVVARLGSPFGSFATAPFAVAAYAVIFWATGGIEPEHIALVRTAASKRFSRLFGRSAE